MIRRRQTVTVQVGPIAVGSGHPVVVQSMTNTDTADVAATVAQVRQLAEAGSDMVRVTVNVPAAEYVCVGVAPVAVPPSPNVHAYVSFEDGPSGSMEPRPSNSTARPCQSTMLLRCRSPWQRRTQPAAARSSRTAAARRRSPRECSRSYSGDASARSDRS